MSSCWLLACSGMILSSLTLRHNIILNDSHSTSFAQVLGDPARTTIADAALTDIAPAGPSLGSPTRITIIDGVATDLAPGAPSLSSITRTTILSTGGGNPSLGTPTRSLISPVTSLITDPAPTCTATVVTAIHTTTYTTQQIVTTAVTSLATRPHRCYTYTATAATPCSGFDAATCPPVPMCILLETRTVTVPCADACCPKTATTTVPRCATCQTGCATATETVTRTSGCGPHVTGALVGVTGVSVSTGDVATTRGPTGTLAVTIF